MTRWVQDKNQIPERFRGKAEEPKLPETRIEGGSTLDHYRLEPTSPRSEFESDSAQRDPEWEFLQATKPKFKSIATLTRPAVD